MKRIEVFYLSRMNQQRAFWFFKNIYNLMSKIDDQRFQPKLRSFRSSLEVFEMTLKPTSNNSLVEKIENENLICNEIWLAIKGLTEELINETASEHSRIGKELQKVLSTQEDPINLVGLRKYDALKKIVGDLENKITVNKLCIVDLYDTVAELKRSIWAYKQFIDVHNIEMAGKLLTRESLDARKEAESAYNNAVEFLNAMFIYKGDAEYTDFINEINHIIELGKSNPIVFDIHREEEKVENPEQQEAFSA